MILRHGLSDTYEVGYVSARGRELRATHLLLWHAVEALLRKRVRWLDLGGIATDRSLGSPASSSAWAARFPRCPGRS